MKLPRCSTSIYCVLKSALARLPLMRHRRCKSATPYFLLTLLALMLIGILEERGGLAKCARDIFARFISNDEIHVVVFDNGKISINSGGGHEKLYKTLPEGREELQRVRSEIFNSDTIDCTATQVKLGDSWPDLCSVGGYALRTHCLGVYAGCRSEQEFAETFADRLPSCSTLGFGSSGELLARSNVAEDGTTSKTMIEDPQQRLTLVGFLTTARTRDSVIDVLLVTCDEKGADLSEFEAAVLNGLLDAVKQLLLRTPASVQLPLHQLSLLSSLHVGGFRQWSHSSNCSEDCLEQRFLNVRFLLDNGRVERAPGYKAAGDLIRTNLSNLTPMQLQLLYHINAEQTHVSCPRNIRIGSGSGVGWNVCFSDSFNIVMSQPNCIVLSFGVNFARNFDNELVDKYGCWSYMFDSGPNGTSKRLEERHHSTSWLLRARLGDRNTTKDGMKVPTLCAVVNRLGYSGRPIDIVKLDINFLEWPVLRVAANEGCLQHVKQLLFKSHTTDGHSQRSNYTMFLSVWQELFKIGFRTWSWNRSTDKDGSLLVPHNFSSSGARTRPCCYVHQLINLRFSGLMQETFFSDTYFGETAS